MSIPESQLSTWAKQGAVVGAKATHEAVRRALSRYGPPVDYEVYLQGSYRNSTNIYSDSDVDVVVQLIPTFQPGLDRLSATQRLTFEQGRTAASYQWPHFRRDIAKALASSFGWMAVSQGNKSIKIAGDSNRRACDVIPCLTYRSFNSYSPTRQDDYAEGIAFWTDFEGRMVVNYPKLHYQNGVLKQSATSARFKRTVRALKNARNAAARRGYLRSGVAPSYFLESLVYNTPDHAFCETLQDSYFQTVSWWSKAPLQSLVCQNERIALFGRSDEQWSEQSAGQLIQALAQLWDNWY